MNRLPLLLLSFLICVAAAASDSTISKQQAQAMLKQLAEALSGDNGTDLVRNKTGMDIGLHAHLESDTLHFYVTYDDIDPVSSEMAKVIFASKRTPSEKSNAEMMAKILEAAECVVSYHYVYSGNQTTTLTLTGDEIIRLKNQPLEQLGFNRQQLIDELVGCFNQGFSEELQSDETLLGGGARLNGKFITLAYKFATSQSFLSDETATGAKQMLLNSLISEFGPSANTLLTQTAQTGDFLGLKGLKFDYSDVTGRQKVFVVSWQELTKALDEFDAQSFPREVTEASLEAIDTQMSINFADEEIPWTQTHLLTTDTLTIIITCNQSETEFDEYFDIFTPDFMLDLYAEPLKIALEDVPEVTSVFIIPRINCEDMIRVTLTRDAIFNYVPVENGDAPYMDEDGHIHT